MPMETMPVPEAQVEKEAVMERYKGERARLLSKIFNRRTVESVALLTPGADVAGLAAFAARGETLVGKKLNPQERLNYAAIAGFLTLSYILYFSGMETEALAARAAAWERSATEFGPELLDGTEALARKLIPSMAPFVEKTGSFLKDKAALAKEVGRSMLEVPAGDPDLPTLNLN
ncbi:MAG TPA: hypothetical protein VMA75_00955 [Candidatus Paceibacterota bacterium]|nr:hypothetical protein [Candidatus Paceibacterota bacterium]